MYRQRSSIIHEGRQKQESMMNLPPPPTFNGMVMRSDKRYKKSHAGIRDGDLRLNQQVRTQMYLKMNFKEEESGGGGGGGLTDAAFNVPFLHIFLISLMTLSIGASLSSLVNQLEKQV